MHFVRLGLILALLLGSAGWASAQSPAGPSDILAPASAQADDASAPANPVKLIFVHHSTGGNWLADGHGQLALELKANNYFVSDTNYGWGPNSIGSTTDIGHWYQWFGAGRSDAVLNALYTESGRRDIYSRLATDPGGENEIILFKSCFPNSALSGNPADPPTSPITSNPLAGKDAGSGYHTVANAKGIYVDLLAYFQSRPDKLFVVITAPPLSSGSYAANARAFNNWLVNSWLTGYPLNNVAVFDFYNVLTSKTANPSDVGLATGNHHRWWQGAVQHKTDGGSNTLAYPSGSGDDHPSPAGGQKATGEFVPLLNIFYHRWKGGSAPAQEQMYELISRRPSTDAERLTPVPAPTGAPCPWCKPPKH